MGRERKSQAGSMLSTQTHQGAWSHNPGIMTWVQTKIAQLSEPPRCLKIWFNLEGNILTIFRLKTMKMVHAFIYWNSLILLDGIFTAFCLGIFQNLFKFIAWYWTIFYGELFILLSNYLVLVYRTVFDFLNWSVSNKLAKNSLNFNRL